MALAFQSRFSVLKIEDDDDHSDHERNEKKATATKKTAPTAVANKTKKKKNNSAKETSQLQNLVIATGKQKANKNSNTSQAKLPAPVKEPQWEEWKQKDDKFVNSSYQQDLEKAILMSKLDYEEKKPIYEERQKEAESDKQGGDQSKKKKKSQAKKDKPATLSLDQFQSLSESQIEAGVTNEHLKQEANSHEGENRKLSTPSEENFFEKIGEDAEKIIQAEHKKQVYKENEPFIADQARSLELREILEQKEKTITELSAENEELKSNLKAAKQRNRKLCNILAQGEIRDKAEILVQVEKLIQVRDELAKEVSELNAALEQERSKNHTLQTELKKQGYKKEGKESKTNS